MPGVKGRPLTGARAKFLINGRVVGFATNLNVTEEIQYDPVEVLDNIEVDEWVPIAYRCSLNASKVRIFGETNKSEGFFPQGGTSPADRLQNILLQGNLVCTIVDSQNPDKAVATFEQVKMTSQNFTVNARGIVAEDVSFVCIRVRDESEVP